MHGHALQPCLLWKVFLPLHDNSYVFAWNHTFITFIAFTFISLPCAQLHFQHLPRQMIWLRGFWYVSIVGHPTFRRPANPSSTGDLRRYLWQKASTQKIFKVKKHQELNQLYIWVNSTCVFHLFSHEILLILSYISFWCDGTMRSWSATPELSAQVAWRGDERLGFGKTPARCGKGRKGLYGALLQRCP